MTGEDGTKQIRVTIVEDNADFRALMEVLLNVQPDIELVSQAGSLAEVRAHTASSVPDVAVLDLGLPDGDGADLIADLRRSNPDVKVLILSATLDVATFERATDADELMDKLASLDEILGTVRRLGNA